MNDLTYVVTSSRRPDPELDRQARQWAERLDVPFVPRADRSVARLCRDEGVDAALTITAERVTLRIPDEQVEYFFHPSMARTRIRNIIDGMGDPMVTAMQLREGDAVLDCTLGRATDATVASWVVGEAGLVVGYEANRLLAELTAHGLATYEIEGPGVEEAMRRIDARHGDCREILPTIATSAFDVVYLDPFFEHTVEQSQAMQPLRRLGLHEPIGDETWEHARRVARRCVVVKRRRDDKPLDLPGVIGVEAGGGSRVQYVVLAPT